MIRPRTWFQKQTKFQAFPFQGAFQKPNGFTVSELLLSLLVGIFITSLCAVQSKTMLNALRLQGDDQEQFSVLQIRELVALSKSARVQNGILYLEYQGKEEVLTQDKNRLVKKPGYEIFLENIEKVYFEQTDQAIELVWIQQAKTKRFQVG